MNACIEILRMSTMMQRIGAQEVTAELVLETVNKLCDEAAARLVSCYGEQQVHLHSADWKDTKYWDLVGVCEDTRLSVPAVGTPFVAYVLDANKMPTLTPHQLQIWLDTLASFAVFDDKLIATKGPALKKEFWAMKEAMKTLAIEDRMAEGGDLSLALEHWGV